MSDLENTSAIVTGGASGLGGAVATHLAERGANVCLFDMNAEAATAMAAKIGATWQMVDVSDADSVKNGFEKARAEQGQERILVNCAGIAPASKSVSRGEPHDPALFAKVIGVNLLGSFYCASTSAAGMVAGDPTAPDGERGVIINTASVAAYEGQIGQVAYASSKGGIVGMTLPMARDLADKGVRVAAIAPGLFKTPMVAGLPQEVQDSLGKQAPFPSRLGNPEEFAKLVGHIIDNPMINGEVIRLDGAIRMTPR